MGNTRFRIRLTTLMGRLFGSGNGSTFRYQITLLFGTLLERILTTTSPIGSETEGQKILEVPLNSRIHESLKQVLYL